jgi:hypothetical protein
MRVDLESVCLTHPRPMSYETREVRAIRCKLIVFAFLLLIVGNVLAQGNLNTHDAVFYNGEVVTVDTRSSVEDALRIFTANPAYATFEEKLKGSIEPGKLADFVILPRDIMTVPDDRILSTQPVATYVGGRKVFSVPNSEF